MINRTKLLFCLIIVSMTNSANASRCSSEAIDEIIKAATGQISCIESKEARSTLSLLLLNKDKLSTSQEEALEIAKKTPEAQGGKGEILLKGGFSGTEAKKILQSGLVGDVGTLPFTDLQKTLLEVDLPVNVIGNFLLISQRIQSKGQWGGVDYLSAIDLNTQQTVWSIRAGWKSDQYSFANDGQRVFFIKDNEIVSVDVATGLEVRNSIPAMISYDATLKTINGRLYLITYDNLYLLDTKTLAVSKALEFSFKKIRESNNKAELVLTAAYGTHTSVINADTLQVKRTYGQDETYRREEDAPKIFTTEGWDIVVQDNTSHHYYSNLYIVPDSLRKGDQYDNWYRRDKSVKGIEHSHGYLRQGRILQKAQQRLFVAHYFDPSQFTKDRLVAYSIPSGEILWSKVQYERGTEIAFGNGHHFILSKKQKAIEAYDSSDGMLLWTLPIPATVGDFSEEKSLEFLGEHDLNTMVRVGDTVISFKSNSGEINYSRAFQSKFFNIHFNGNVTVASVSDDPNGWSWRKRRLYPFDTATGKMSCGLILGGLE